MPLKSSVAFEKFGCLKRLCESPWRGGCPVRVPWRFQEAAWSWLWRAWGFTRAGRCAKIVAVMTMPRGGSWTPRSGGHHRLVALRSLRSQHSVGRLREWRRRFSSVLVETRYVGRFVRTISERLRWGGIAFGSRSAGRVGTSSPSRSHGASPGGGSSADNLGIHWNCVAQEWRVL